MPMTRGQRKQSGLVLENDLETGSAGSGASSSSGRKVLVTGGCGFVGNRLAETLLADPSVSEVRVFDIREGANPEFKYLVGDLRRMDDVRAAVRGCTEVYHVASLTELSGARQLFIDINIQGTANVIKACQLEHVPTLVYTSSASVVFDGVDLLDGDESLPYPESFLDFYTYTKAEAEKLVLAANGVDGLATVAIRPHSIFGPGDQHFWPKVIANAEAGRLRFYMGDGKNLSDYTFVDNCVLGHTLAAERLRTEKGRRVVGGQAYFITNGQPANLWGTMKEIAVGVGIPEAGIGSARIPYSLAYTIGFINEYVYWGIGMCCRTRGPTLTRYVAANTCTNHFFSIEKARRDLGYEPTPHAECMKITIDYYRKQRESRLKNKQA